MNLHTAGHRRGVVCAPHAAAVEDGRAILAEGGNAIEAMLAMAASIAAVYPHMNHIGGDGFWLIRERVRPRARADGRGTGRRQGDATALSRAGHDAIPARGPLAALTVPGAVAAWMLAPEAAKAQGGRLPLDVLLGARDQACARGLRRHAQPGAADAPKNCRRWTRRAGFHAAFLVDGKPPELGARSSKARFAATLEHLADAGLDDFYRGDVGREIAADLERIGSPVTRADLEKFHAMVAEPLSVRDRRPARSTTRRRRRKAWPRSSSWRCSSGCASRKPKASSTCTASSKRPSAPSACATASSPIRT